MEEGSLYEHWYRRAQESLRLWGISPFEGDRDLLRQASCKLRTYPFLIHRLNDDPEPSALEILLNLRLCIQHHFINPLIQGESFATRARSLCQRLEEREREEYMRSQTHADQKTLLRYETLLDLHPSPHNEEYRVCIQQTQALVERSHRVREKISFRTRVSQMAAQHRAFYRYGWHWIAYRKRRTRIKKITPSEVFSNSNLRSTFHAIEEIGPIVDNFAFRGAKRARDCDHVAIADLAFLYMQLADELVDQLATQLGAPALRQLIANFQRHDPLHIPLSQLSDQYLASLGADLETRCSKYQLSLGEIRTLLRKIEETLKTQCQRFSHEKSYDLNAEVLAFFRLCFETFIDEIYLRSSAESQPDQQTLSNTAWHFYRKNNLVMMRWLWLRAQILELNPKDFADTIQHWSYLLASFQIFDDLKDLWIDLGRQPNYLLHFAANEYPNEYVWISEAQRHQAQTLCQEDVLDLHLHAPLSVLACLTRSRLMALCYFDNVLLYAWDQRWQMSWTNMKKSINPKRSNTKLASFPEMLEEIILRSRPLKKILGDSDEYRAYIVDTLAYSHAKHLIRYFWWQPRTLYRFLTLRMAMSAQEKAQIFEQLVPKLRVRQSDVYHQVRSNGLELST